MRTHINTHPAHRALCGRQNAGKRLTVKQVQQGNYPSKWISGGFCKNCFQMYWKFHHDGRDGSEKAQTTAPGHDALMKRVFGKKA